MDELRVDHSEDLDAPPDADPAASEPSETSGPSGPSESSNGSSWPARIHPLGWVSIAVLVVAGLYHTVLDTNYLIGNLAWWTTSPQSTSAVMR